MNRPIKFRAWSILDKRMLQWSDIFTLPAWEIFSGTPEQRAFNVMQFVDRHDEKNVSIYEGDILEYYSAVVPKGTNPMIRTVARWNKRRSAFEGCFQGVIIGNIYENPELIAPNEREGG